MKKHPVILKISNLSKSYPGVQALTNINLDFQTSEVHALVGENGAGKSTLARIISGLEKPDTGTLRLKGKLYTFSGKTDVENKGVRMVMQELNLIPTLSVAENIFLNRMPGILGIINKRRLHVNASKVMAQVGLGSLDPQMKVCELGVGQQQMVEIAAGLSRRCELLILDEPTAALTDSEIELLFSQIERLKQNGVCIIYISHRLEEIKRIADKVTVLRDGKVIGTRDVNDVRLDDIVQMMVGRELENLYPHATRKSGETILRVKNLCRGRAVRDVSFELRCGEILGFAGLTGSGRTETMRLIFGADQPDSGNIYLRDAKRPVRIRSPRNAVQRGIALLTEDRKQQGLLMPLSIRANITLARMESVSTLGWIRLGSETLAANQFINALSVQCTSSEQPVQTLSGGNQQRVIIARWLYRDCDILIFDEPTRGIDVGAKFDIYTLLMRLADQGKAIIVVSSDMLELLAISDRIAVMSAGKLVAIFKRGEWTQDKIMAAALSEYAGSEGKA